MKHEFPKELKRVANNLAEEESPYLLQHAYNPVNWYPWGEKTFKKAREENKLIFLSIGYSTCHWCHVMERESFENEQIATLLNESFVSVKVDREEMPHIDKHYQEVYTLLNRSGGGWPLTIIMTPDRKPFFAATYLPPEDKYGRTGLLSMLPELVRIQKEDYATIEKSATSIARALDSFSNKPPSGTGISPAITATFMEQFKQGYDSKYKGLGSAPKFPQASSIQALLDLYLLDGDKEALQMATETLEAMAKGGINDQIEGGFYRYSVDEAWIIPHFEKMLYTNAELLEAYIKAYQITQKTLFFDAVQSIIAAMKERFLHHHLYYSASDADSDGEEGKYFVFDYRDSYNELIEGGFLPQEAVNILAYFNITEEGNFEHGKSNPYLTIDVLPKDVEKAKVLLKENRRKKNYPFIDNKIMTSWNSMMITALFKASILKPDYAQDAQATLNQLIKYLYLDGVLYHQIIWGTKPKVKAYLEDYAFLVEALLVGYGQTYRQSYLDLAEILIKKARESFYDQNTWYFSKGEFKTAAPLEDTAYRSAKAVMIANIATLAALQGALEQHAQAKKMMEMEGERLSSHPLAYAEALRTWLKIERGFIIIKTPQHASQKDLENLQSISYPYLLLQPTSEEKFLACEMDTCFSAETDVKILVENITSRKTGKRRNIR